ncbi:hypothetical protein GCM10025868_20140 [Angustibacter aerolatus]|uniref:Glycosyltransferase 2-like domain-containing protein n=1 Tax=Angustibacter aerolatus TaxID=1162965 RepID=A0ABQ6JI26_9ACTN|nr:hypothetical protein GCM10025868_20140 [Angustibacter aerolatus]
MLIPVEVLQRLGGFDPRFRFGGEEEDFCRRALTAGEHLLYTPESMLLHDFEPGLADTLRRSRAYGRGNARMFVKYPQPAADALPAARAGGRAARSGRAAAQPRGRRRGSRCARAAVLALGAQRPARPRPRAGSPTPTCRRPRRPSATWACCRSLPRARRLFAPSPLPEQVRT